MLTFQLGDFSFISLLKTVQVDSFQVDVKAFSPLSLSAALASWQKALQSSSGFSIHGNQSQAMSHGPVSLLEQEVWALWWSGSSALQGQGAAKTGVRYWGNSFCALNSLQAWLIDQQAQDRPHILYSCYWVGVKVAWQTQQTQKDGSGRHIFT